MTDQPLKVLAIGAHPDDIEIYAGGLMLALKQAGAELHYVIATDGSLSNGPPADPELAAARAKEAAAAAAYTGAPLEMLGYPDGYLGFQESAPRRILDAIEARRPHLILTHHESDYHNDHRAVARLVRNAITPNQPVLHFEPFLGLGAPPNFLVDITEHMETKVQAVMEHKTQKPEQILRSTRTWNAFRALQMGMRGVHYAEGFIVPPSYTVADPRRAISKLLTTIVPLN